MKILHTADLHINNFSRLKKFSDICGLAIKFSCRVILIAGDLFNSKKPSKKLINEFLKIVNERNGIKFFYCSGDSDQGVLENSGMKMPKNIKIASEEKLSVFNVGQIEIISMGYKDNRKIALPRKNKKIRIGLFHGLISDKESKTQSISNKYLGKEFIDFIALGHFHDYEKGNSFVYAGSPIKGLEYKKKTRHVGMINIQNCIDTNRIKV